MVIIWDLNNHLLKFIKKASATAAGIVCYTAVFRVTQRSSPLVSLAHGIMGPLLGYGQPFFVWLSRDWPSERVYRLYGWGVGETIKRTGGMSQACLGKTTSFILDIHNMVNWHQSKQDSHWPVSHDRIAGSCVNSSRWRDLFESCPLTS